MRCNITQLAVAATRLARNPARALSRSAVAQPNQPRRLGGTGYPYPATNQHVLPVVKVGRVNWFTGIKEPNEVLGFVESEVAIDYNRENITQLHIIFWKLIRFLSFPNNFL